MTISKLVQDIKNSDIIKKINEIIDASTGGSSRNIGEIVKSTVPLTDAGLHLLDGSLLAYGSYKAFIDYIASIYDTSASYFTDETTWQNEVTTYGVCGKFVYDNVNNTVRLPKYNSKIYTGGGEAQVKGDGKTLGLTNGSLNSGLIYTDGVYFSSGAYGKSVSTSDLGSAPNLSGTIGVTTDPTKSGIIADLSTITTSLDGYYYIVVATSTKTEIEVDINEVMTDLNGKVSKADCYQVYPVITEYVNGTSGYRIWSSGYCEQWGQQVKNASSISVVFLKTFTDTNYNVTTSCLFTANVSNWDAVSAKTTTGMTVQGSNNAASYYFVWKASGYLAEGQY